LSRLVVRRDDERRPWVFDVLIRDGGQAFLARADFMHTPLMIKAHDRSSRAFRNEIVIRW
jgi:hypothetical protein